MTTNDMCDRLQKMLDQNIFYGKVINSYHDHLLTLCPSDETKRLAYLISVCQEKIQTFVPMTEAEIVQRIGVLEKMCQEKNFDREYINESFLLSSNYLGIVEDYPKKLHHLGALLINCHVEIEKYSKIKHKIFLKLAEMNQKVDLQEFEVSVNVLLMALHEYTIGNEYENMVQIVGQHLHSYVVRFGS